MMRARRPARIISVEFRIRAEQNDNSLRIRGYRGTAEETVVCNPHAAGWRYCDGIVTQPESGDSDKFLASIGV
jgi:hypothetical protein